MTKILSSLLLAASVTLVAGCGCDRAPCADKSCATKSACCTEAKAAGTACAKCSVKADAVCCAEAKAAGKACAKCPAPAVAPAPAAK